MATSTEEKSASHSDHDEYSQVEKAGGGKSAGFTSADQDGADVPWTAKRIIAIIALCFVYVGSQMILYFVSPALTYIQLDFGTTLPNWLLTSNTLAVTAICPFVGYLTDMVGRRYIALFGALLLVISSIVMATAHSLAVGIVAMTIGGIGAGICELTALAGYVAKTRRVLDCHN